MLSRFFLTHHSPFTKGATPDNNSPFTKGAGGIILSLILTVSLAATTALQAMPAADSPANKLTASERAKGWQLLFDGISMKGWRTYQNKKADSWSVKAGVLYCKAPVGKGDLRSDIITVDKFENFELSIDWKISPKGNSGILYMVNETNEGAHLSGPEYQIIDDVNFPQKLEDWQKTGANYAMDPAPTAAPNAAGEWNSSRIIVNKNHVEHWLNGKKIVEYDLYSDKWKKEKESGKWKDAPGYGMSKKGYIALQDHGSEAWFKNIKIRKL